MTFYSLLLVLAAALDVVSGAAYKGDIYGTNGVSSNVCPDNYEPMTKAECDAAASHIVPNGVSAQYLELVNLMKENGGFVTFGNDAIQLQGDGTIVPVNEAGGKPHGCFMDTVDTTGYRGFMIFNTQSTKICRGETVAQS